MEKMVLRTLVGEGVPVVLAGVVAEYVLVNDLASGHAAGAAGLTSDWEADSLFDGFGLRVAVKSADRDHRGLVFAFYPPIGVALEPPLVDTWSFCTLLFLSSLMWMCAVDVVRIGRRVRCGRRCASWRCCFGARGRCRARRAP